MNKIFYRAMGHPAAMALLFCSLWCADASARPVTPEEATQSAAAFFAGKDGYAALRSPSSTVSPLNMAVAEKYSLNGVDCFYIVNSDNGFVIITADTRLPEVLGYSDNGRFDKTRISDNMRWWLDEYTREIESWLPTAPEALSSQRRIVRKENRTAIEPLVKTLWDQGTPYNNDCPIDANYGVRSATGCVATAMAQIMKYHEWPKKPTGSHGGIVFNNTTYEWDNMIDRYVNNKWTTAQASAVATLMRQCGASVDMTYSATGSGAYDNHVPVALYTYFGYTKGLRFENKDYIPQSRWEDMIYSELTEARPVYYSGASSQGGHAFVCDGYLANSYFHFNWGWSGYQDGYYRLTALNPESGGSGSYEGGYNSHQSIIRGIKPAVAGEQATEQVTILSTGSFYYKDGVFTTQDGLFGDTNIFYNPLFITANVSFGIRIERYDAPDVEPVYVRCGGSISLAPNYGTTEYAGNIPASLADGIYHIYGVFTTDGKDWQDILIPLGKQDFVTLTVENGKQTFTNAGLDPSRTPKLVMGTPETSDVIYQNGTKYFRVPFINVGEGDYLGEIGLSLFSDDEFGDVISANNSVSIPGHSFQYIEFSSLESAAPGEYKLYVNDSEGNEIPCDYTYNIIGSPIKPDTDSGIYANDYAPNFLNTGDEKMLYITLGNTSLRQFRTHVNFRFCDPGNLSVVKQTISSAREVSLNPGEETRIAFGPVKLNFPAGQYTVIVYDDDNNPISNPFPLIVESAQKFKGGISYVVTDENNKLASVTAPQGNPYSGYVLIPDVIDGYTVDKVRQDAFAFATTTHVIIPENISHLENGGFYNARHLINLDMKHEGIVEISSETFNPENREKLWLGVPNSMANLYARNDAWIGCKIPCYDLVAEDGTAFTGIQNDPTTNAPYAPYYVSAYEPFSFGATVSGDSNILIEVKANGDFTYQVIADGESFEAKPLKYTAGVITLKPTNAQVAVDEINADATPSAVYSVDGRIVVREALPSDLKDLEPGLYIYKSRKIRIR